MEKHEHYMREALKQAQLALEEGEVPVGAVVVQGDEIIGHGRNSRVGSHDASAHAEIQAIRMAGAAVGSWNLSGCKLYVTLEPCAMCAGAISNARLDEVFFGATDLRFGALGGAFNHLKMAKTNHSFGFEGAILANECAQILQIFFKSKR